MARARTRRAAVTAILLAVRDSRRPDAPGLRERLAATPRMIRASVRGRYRGVSGGRLGAMTLAAVYIISPFDLVPEALLTVFGLADDAVVALWLVGALLDETGRFLAWERSRT